jgi:hypothetical protein
MIFFMFSRCQKLITKKTTSLISSGEKIKLELASRQKLINVASTGKYLKTSNIATV